MPRPDAMPCSVSFLNFPSQLRPFQGADNNILSITCGCIACAHCVLANFRGQLTARIERLPLSRPRRTVAIPPTSRRELNLMQRWLLREVGMGRNPKGIFNYSCPCCKALVKKPPVISQQFDAIVDIFTASTRAQVVPRKRRMTRSTTRDFFAGLFLDQP